LRKLQNFAARSYCFAAAIPLFHALGNPPFLAPELPYNGLAPSSAGRESVN
jgi:hypothetical protein